MNDLEVILFKSEGDNYIETFRENGITCMCIPPIEFEYINRNDLNIYLSKPLSFSGIIFTSPRSVEAIEGIYKSLDVATHLEWKSKKNFGMGYSTEEKLNTKLGLSLLGKGAGNSQQLCSQILKDVEPFSLPLLYPCGNLRRDDLPIILAKNDIDFKAITCYNTKPHSKLELTLSSILLEAKPKYMTFFSPSGVHNSIPLLQKIKYDFQGTKVIAIGPATNEALVKEGIPVCGICPEPTAQAIIKLIK